MAEDVADFFTTWIKLLSDVCADHDLHHDGPCMDSFFGRNEWWQNRLWMQDELTAALQDAQMGSMYPMAQHFNNAILYLATAQTVIYWAAIDCRRLLEQANGAEPGDTLEALLTDLTTLPGE